MLVSPADCSRFHSRARQQPGDPVMESPSGMMRTGSMADAAGRTARTTTDATTADVSAVTSATRRRRERITGLQQGVSRPLKLDHARTPATCENR
jgi:hypothetical protein